MALKGREPLDVSGLNEMIDRFLLTKRGPSFDSVSYRRSKSPVTAG